MMFKVFFIGNFFGYKRSKHQALGHHLRKPAKHPTSNQVVIGGFNNLPGNGSIIGTSSCQVWMDTDARRFPNGWGYGNFIIQHFSILVLKPMVTWGCSNHVEPPRRGPSCASWFINPINYSFFIKVQLL